MVSRTKSDVQIRIHSEADIVTARRTGRTMAGSMGFGATDLTMIATAISEVARNMVVYAGSGMILLDDIQGGSKNGIRIVAVDEGPGIPDVEQALRDGFSTGDSLGLGLPGSKRMMDEFELLSERGKGTKVTMVKWKNG